MGVKCPKCQHENPDDTLFCGKCGTQFSSQEKTADTKTLETPKEDLASGSTFAGRYQIIEELGKGGMGRVYKVLDKETKEKIALKLVKPEIASDKKTIERFRSELTTARKIGHRNVCRMYDLNKEKDSYYITMEFVSGGDLKRLIRRTKRLDTGTAISIVKQICDGLSEAHSLGIVHRDLKPNNIMIDDNGNARIMDFGIAHSLGKKGITGEGIIIGTPEYMSPEQAEAMEVDQRSDIYSLGVILYEMVTEQLPFKGETPLSIAMKHKSEKPPNPKEINDQIPEELSQIILCCLEKDRENRYQSAAELSSELDNIAKGMPTSERASPRDRPITSREITVKLNLQKLLIPASVLISIIVAAIILWQLWSKKDVITILSDRPSLAVVYFENLSRDESLDGWTTGLSDLLITDLMQSKFIDVLPRDRVFSILRKLDLLEAKKYSTEDLLKVANEGRIDHTISGSFIKAGENIIITMQLQKPHTGEVISSIRKECQGQEEIPSKLDEFTKQIKRDLNLTGEQIVSDIDKELQTITTSSPQAYKYYNEGKILFRNGDYRQTIAYMEKALDIDTEFAMAYYGLAQCYDSLYLDKEHDKYMQKAVELSDRLPDRERLIIQGKFYERSAETREKAIAAYNQLSQLYPEEFLGDFYLADLYMDLEEWDKAIEHFEVLVQSKNQQALRLYPILCIDSYTSLAGIYRRKGLYDKAREILELYLQNISDNERIHRQMALTLVCQGNLDLALIEVEKAIALETLHYENYMMKGNIYHFQGDLFRAEKEYRRLLEIKEPASRGLGRGRLANLSLLQGRFEEAKNHVRHILEIADQVEEPGWRSGWICYLGVLHLSEGNAEAALQLFKQGERIAIEAEQHHWREMNLDFKGIVYISMRSIDKALAVAEELKELVQEGLSQNVMRRYFYLLGLIELEKGNFPLAVEHFGQALSLIYFQYQSISGFNNEHVLYRNSLALAYYKMGEMDKAKEEYEKITYLTTGRLYYGDVFAKSYYQLGKIYDEQGNKTTAIEHYEKFLDLWKDSDPGLSEVDDAKQRLARLKSH